MTRWTGIMAVVSGGSILVAGCGGAPSTAPAIHHRAHHHAASPTTPSVSSQARPGATAWIQAARSAFVTEHHCMGTGGRAEPPWSTASRPVGDYDPNRVAFDNPGNLTFRPSLSIT